MKRAATALVAAAVGTLAAALLGLNAWWAAAFAVAAAAVAAQRG